MTLTHRNGTIEPCTRTGQLPRTVTRLHASPRPPSAVPISTHSPNRHSPNRRGHAGFPRIARRLDVKVYPPCMRACAVNYFTGSGLFNRMLRYWCDRPTAAVAARAATHLPGGAVFHLSDRCLAVRPLPRAEFAAASAGTPPPSAAARTAGRCRACSLSCRAVTGRVATVHVRHRAPGSAQYQRCQRKMMSAFAGMQVACDSVSHLCDRKCLPHCRVILTTKPQNNVAVGSRPEDSRFFVAS